MNRRVSFLVGLALAGFGCKSGPSIVGKWSGDAHGMPATFEYKADNTFDIQIKQDKISVDVTGTYKLEAKKLTVTTTDYKVQGATPPFDEPIKKQLEPTKGKSQESIIAFNSDDELAVTSTEKGPAAKTEILKRVKETKDAK